MKILTRKLDFDSKNLMCLMEILCGSIAQARIIGGSVRDRLLGLPSSDIDIACSLIPQEVIELLTQYKIKVIPTGLSFGTVTAVIGDESFEITSLRKDIKCDGRHAIVEFTNDFALDAARRDFTINALSYCPFECKIYDYYNGLKDIEACKVRFIGDPLARIEEDYLRILRFFRFSALYSDEIDEEGLKACLALGGELAKLPRERINIEIDKLLPAKNAFPVLCAMTEGGIDVMAELQLNIMNVHPLKLSGLYAILLLKNDIVFLKEVLPSLRFPKKMIRDIVDLVEFMTSKPFRQNFLEIWIDEKDAVEYLTVALTLSLIEENAAKALMERFSLRPPKLPVNGEDLSKHFHGDALGIALAKIKKAWIESDLIADKTTLMRLL